MDADAQKLLGEEGRRHLAAVQPLLAAVSDWQPSVLEEKIREYVASSGAKLGSVAQPLRAALTGRKTSPGIFEVLEMLGKEESLARIGDQAA